MRYETYGKQRIDLRDSAPLLLVEFPQTPCLRRIALPIVIVLVFLASVASGQTKPDAASVSVGPLGVKLTIIACQSDAFGEDQTKTNCYNFGIYRNPPGYDKSMIGTAYLINSSSIPFTDPDSANLKVGQAYSYRVCTNIYPDSSGSNCITTSAITIPAKTIQQPPIVSLQGNTGSVPYGGNVTLSWTSSNVYKLEISPGIGKVAVPSGSINIKPPATQTYTLIGTASDGKQASAYFNINVNCPTPTVPGSVSASSSPSGINLKWTNPNTPAGQWCPVPSNQVLIYRLDPGLSQFKLVATLTKAANNGILPNHYTDQGPFQPHTGYLYEVCEVGPPNWLTPSDCDSPRGAAVSWGADPVLTATRVNANTIRLRLNLDQNTVSSVMVTRQGSDDPCRQGQTLANGLQGCPDSPQMLAQNTPVIYNWTLSAQSPVAPGFDHPQTPPFVIDIPDDATVHPGSEYWYQTGVVWLGTLEQNAATVTVPSFYATAGAHGTFVGGAAQPVKQNGNAPPPQAGSSVGANPMIRSTMAPSSATINRAPAATRPMLEPAQPMMSPSGTSTPSTPPGAKPMMAPAPQPAPSTMTQAGVLRGGTNRMSRLQQSPPDAQALYALGKAYCGRNLKRICTSYMYMAISSAQSAGNTSLVKQIKASLPAQ